MGCLPQTLGTIMLPFIGVALAGCGGSAQPSPSGDVDAAANGSADAGPFDAGFVSPCPYAAQQSNVCPAPGTSCSTDLIRVVHMRQRSPVAVHGNMVAAFPTPAGKGVPVEPGYLLAQLREEEESFG
jgi:hypothetical protein